MASLIQLVQGSRLRMRPLQFSLHQQWPDRRRKLAKLMVTSTVKDAVLWWLDQDRLHQGVSLEVKTPSVHLWTDASLAGWGGHTSSWQASGLWDATERHLHINALEIRAMLKCLQLLPSLEKGTVVALQGDNTTALAYVRNLGGTRSFQCYDEAKAVCLWAERNGVTLMPRFVPGRLSVGVDAL